MKLILHQATLAITEIDFVPGPFRFQIEQQHLDFAVVQRYSRPRLTQADAGDSTDSLSLFHFELLLWLSLASRAGTHSPSFVRSSAVCSWVGPVP